VSLFHLIQCHPGSETNQQILNNEDFILRVFLNEGLIFKAFLTKKDNYSDKPSKKEVRMNVTLKKQKMFTVCLYFLLVMQIIAAYSAVLAASLPTIQLLNVPPYGARVENLTGVILSGIPDDYQVGVYIFVDGWRKKNVDRINIDGYWICDITTQNNDWMATHIDVFLFHKDFQIPRLNNDKLLPTSFFENAIFHKEVIRKPMTTR